jgi:hypothetical protein
MNLEGWKRIFIRAAGFGAGAILMLVVCAGSLYWWSNRPKPWSDSAISATYTQISLHEENEEVQVSFEYSLTNHTNAPYSLPTTYSGALMRRIPKEKSFEKFDTGSWDDTLVIPPGQSFNVRFNVVYKLSEYGTTTAELNTLEPGEDRKKEASQALVKFMNRRLNEVDGLVFYDYVNHYRIELPRNWEFKDLEK